ncbi:hypothetical protein EK904_009497, partial [Melospiza melodia maxima]
MELEKVGAVVEIKMIAFITNNICFWFKFTDNISNSREIDAVHEEYKQKLRDQEAFHRKQIQRQQLYVEDLKQQILRGQIKAEQELENDQALINQQIQEHQQWLINENKRLAALQQQQQQREFAVQTEPALCAEAEVQSTTGLDTCLSLLQQNKKRLVQLELLQRYSLKKAERNIRRKKVKFRLERIVKKQKLLEAKQNLEQLEASCWLSEECVKPSQGLSDSIAVQSSLDHHLQKRQKLLGLRHRHLFRDSYLPQVPSCFSKRESVSKISTSPNIDQYCKGSRTERLSPVEYLYKSDKDISGSDDLNDGKGISFSVQRQLTEKQKTSSIEIKKGGEKYSNDSAIMAYISKNYKKMEKLDDSPGQGGSQNQTSKGSSPDLFKEKDEPKTFITGRRMTKSKVLGDLSQPASSNVAQNKPQVSNKKIRMDINGKGHRSSPENFPKQMKKTVYGNPPSVHLNQTVKNWRREANSALPSHEKSSAEEKEFLMAATSVGNLTKMNSQTPLSYVEKKWHSAEMLSAGVPKTATDMLENWQEDDENEISDTDSSYSVDSLSCAYAKAVPEKLKLEDFDRNKCLANPEDSESDDSQMSQDSLIEKENKAKKQNTSQFHKLKAHHEPAKLYKSRTENHISSLVTSYASRRRLGKAERSFSLDSLADGEEMPAEDLVEESKSDSSDEMPAEIFWKLQTPKLPAIQTEENHESKTCNRDTEGANYDQKLSSSFYLNTKPHTASSNACKQLLKGTKVSFAEQERSPERRLYYASGHPLLNNDAWPSCDSKVDISSPRITTSSSHENLEFQDAHLCSSSKPELWLKKDDLKQSAAEVSFVSGSKQIHSITHSPHHVIQINSVLSSDALEVPLPETTTASRTSESGSLNKILKGWTNSNENSSLESANVTSSFASSVGPSSSFVPTSAEHDYSEHSRSHHPEQEQLGELSTCRSASERAQAFSCLESTSTAGCLSLVSKKEENSVTVLPVQIVEQTDGCVDTGLEDGLFQSFSKDGLDNDYNNLMSESSVADSGSGNAPVSEPAAECSMGLAHNMTSTQTSAIKHIQFGNCGHPFPVQKIPTCCDEGFFLSDLTNKSCSLVSSYKLQMLAGQGAESADTEEPPRSGESNLETMQETDHEQIPAEVTAETDFSSQKITYQCHPSVVAASTNYDQSATPIEMSQKETICMEISTDSLADIVPEVPSFRDHDEYISKDEDLSSLNHYEFKHKPDSKDYSPECALADGQVSRLSQQISENSTLCTDNIREESSESKEHNVLNSQAVVQKEFSSKYENLVVNEGSYFLLNVNGKNTKSFPAAICENTNYFLPESNSSLFYKISTKANLFQSACETKNYDKLLEHVTIVKGNCDATSNLTVEVGVTKSCSDVHSGCLCPTCSSTSTGQKNTTHKTTDISAEFGASVLSETETQNKSLLESRGEEEAFFESDCPVDFHAEYNANSELGKVFECNTNASAAISQEESSCRNKEYKIFRDIEMDTEEAMAPYQNTGTATDEEITKSINNASNLEKSALEIKSRHTESLPDRPAAQVQSITEDSKKDFKDIGLTQNPKKSTDITACEIHCEFNTNLCLTHEEVHKDELQEAGTGAECTQESKALVHSGSQPETSSFCKKEISEKTEIGIYSTELSVAPKTIPSSVCSYTIDVIQNTLGFLDTCKGLLQMNGTTENVAETVLIPRRQGNISAKLENEGQINSNNIIELCVPNSSPQEDKVNECEVTGSEEQITMTNTEELVSTGQKELCTDENVYFNEQSPALRQVYCDRGDTEEILDQFKIPERYLMASEVESNILLGDDSRYQDPTEMSEDGDSVDSATEIGNVVDAYEYSVEDSAVIDQYRTKQKFTSLDRHTDDSHLVQDVPTALRGCTKPSNSSLGTGAVLPYYETLMESEISVGASVAANKMGETNKHLPAKTPSKSVPLLQTSTMQQRQEEESFVFKNGPDYAISAQPVNENSSSTPYSAGGLECGTVVLQQRAKGSSFFLEKLDSSEDIIQDIDNVCEEHGMDFMVNEILKDCPNSIEDTAQEVKDTIVPDSLMLDTSNLLSSSEKEVMEDVGVRKPHSLLESSTQKIFQNINTTQIAPHLGASSVHDEKTFLSASHPTANSKCENAEFPSVAGYQHEPTENQEREASEECCVDQSGNAVSENSSALSEGLNKSPKEHPHYSKDFLNYNRNLDTFECSPGLLNCPASSADSLIVSSGDKGINNNVLSEETKYFESESTDLSVTFPGVSQKGDEKENNSAVAETTYAQSNKLPGKVVETEKKEEIVQGYFQNCGDIKEGKIHEFSEHCSNTNRVTVPESGLLTFQSPGQTGCNESKSLPSHSADETPPETPFQSSKNFSAFTTSSLLGDSKSLVFNQLEGSFQDSCSTEKVSCNSADVCSVKGDFPLSLARIGWKQYAFGSASDVSCNQIPLNMENRKVMRCSSVDNGLNSQNSPFRSHLSSYATAKVLSSTLSSIEGLQEWDSARQDFKSVYSSDSTKQYSNISSETLETNSENNTAELENPSTQPGNSSMQVDEIVLLYPSESEKPSNKPPGITCEQGTQTAATGRYKRQRRHQRSYTDVSAKKEETNRDLFYQPSSWTSMQNLSMHLSQLLQNTSELLGNLSQQSIIDSEQNAKINQKRTEGAVRSDSCTQTTADVGTQTEILEKPQSKHEEKQVEAKMGKELRAAQAVNVDWKKIGAEIVGEIPKRKEETLTLEESTQVQTGMKHLGNSDFHDSLDSILEDSFMHLPSLPKNSTPILHFQKTSLNAQQNVAFASTRVSPLTPSLPSSGQDGSSCTVVSSPTNSTSQSPTAYTQDKRSVNEAETPAERKFWYKNTLLVDRASSPILTLSASPSSQTAFSKSVCPTKEPLGYSSVASSPFHTKRKLRAGPQFSMQHHVDSFSQTETDSESSISREHKSIRKKSGTFSDKKAGKDLLGQDGSKDLEQQHRLRVDSHTTICAERLYHSSSMLEVSGHSEVVTGDARDQGSVAHSLHCMYVTRGGRAPSGGIGHEKYSGNSDTALIHNYPSPNVDLLFNQKISATCSSKTNAGTASEPLVEASSVQFHDFFWKSEESWPPPLSDVSDVQTSFQDDSTESVTGSECDTEIPLSKNSASAKPCRPRSYSLRDLPIHNKFSNWCGVKSSTPPVLLGLSGSVTDLRGQADKKPGSTQSTEVEGNYQSCDSRSREIKKLQRERAQIMSSIHLDLHQHPLTVELTEAKLNYGIGETDALLKVLQRGAADEPGTIPVKQQLYERHMRTIETLRKERVKRLQRYQRSRSLSPLKHLSLSQTLDASQRDPDLPSRRREYLQQLRRDVVENTRVQEPKRRSIQHPSDIELLLRDYQRAREETKTEIARARDKLRERAEQEKRRIREQILSQLQKEEARLKTLASTSTLCTDSSLSLSSGPTSGYNSSNTATYTASNFSSQEGQVSSGNTLVTRDTRGRSAVRNSQLYTLEQLHKDSTFEASRIQPPLPSSGTSCRFTHGLTISVNSSSTKGYQDLSKHILANATTEVMAACSQNLRNLYTCQAEAGWKYQCTEKEVQVYYKAFPSATRHGFLGAGVIERPLPFVWGLVRDPGKRHLYDSSVNTARIHKKVTSHIHLVYIVTDTSLCYLKQPRDFCCITAEAKEENLSVLAFQSVYDASMPQPCKEAVRGEILPSAWILEPDIVNGREITRVIYMAQVDLGAPAIPARLLSSVAKQQPLCQRRILQVSGWLLRSAVGQENKETQELGQESETQQGH